MQTQNQPYTRINERQPVPPPSSTKGLSAATVLLPLRIFLGISFIAAGIDKLTDKEFFDSNAIGYIGNQLAAFAKQSPIGGFLTTFAVPNATIFGALVLAGELAIGLGTLVGLFSRTAAFFGFILSMTLWLTATWNVAPFFLGSDLPYAMGWLTLALAGAHPVFSLDGQIRREMARVKAEQVVKIEGSPADSGLPQRDTALLAFETETENPQEQVTLARKHFVMVAGATVLASAITGVAWANTLQSKAEAAAQSSGTGQASIGATPDATATSTSAPTSAPATATSAATAAPTTQSNQPATTSAPATATNKPTVAPTTAPAATKAPTSAAAAKGPVLAALSSIPVGEAKAFTTPDTNQPAYLVHEADGSVKAFSAICTHEGCEVSYSKSSQLFVCPCHGAQFNASTGAAVRGPARRPLASFKVQVDNGNIIYTQG